MCFSRLMNWLRPEQEKTKAVTVYEVQDHRGTYKADVMVNGRNREVVLFRPPVILGEDGRTLPGVDRGLVARWLVATTGMLAQMDLGVVRVEWQERVGRFASATILMETWGQSLTVLMPVHVISGELEKIMDMYRSALCLKARQIHRGHQNYEEANRILRRAAERLMKLRDAQYPHFTDPELLYVSSRISEAQVMNALVPLPSGDGDEVMGESTRVYPNGGRVP